METNNNCFEFNNYNSHQKKNTMNIITNKDYYFKGELCEGNIILELISVINLNDISISLFSKENWLIQETSNVKYGEKNIQLLSKFDLGIHKFLNLNSEINLLSKGRYVFPFKIELPSYLEPSFEYPIPNRSSYLRYVLESEVISNDIKLKTNKNILIKSYSKFLRTPKIFSSITNVHKWGMFDGGSTILKASYEKNNYKIDELVPLNIEIDNTRGKLKVKECKIRIIRTIQFSKLDKESIEKYPLEKTIYSKVFWAEVMPNSKRSFLFQTELKDKDLIDFNYLGENNPYPEIHDINYLLPSLEGRIIKCEYRIQISLYFNNFVTSGYRPRVSLPILIIHQFKENSNLSNLPNDNEINNINYSNNNICCDSSLLYDKNYFENLKEKNYNVINNRNNENEKNNMYIENDNFIEFSKIEDIKRDNQNNSKEIDKKQNYIPLKEENYYNINEV